MNSVKRQIQKALADVETIQSFIHPLGDPDPKQNLYMARSRREDAVRTTVLQMSLSIEDMLDSLFARVFVGHDPNSKRKARKGKMFRELEDLLGGRMGFEAKLKLASVLKIAVVVGDGDKFVLLNPDGATPPLKTIFEI